MAASSQGVEERLATKVPAGTHGPGFEQYADMFQKIDSLATRIAVIESHREVSAAVLPSRTSKTDGGKLLRFGPVQIDLTEVFG
jgi:hypothetical protein